MFLQRNNRWIDLGQIQSGLSYKQSANRFGVHRSTISRFHQRFRTKLRSEWRQFPQATVRTVRSMRRRHWRTLLFQKISTVTLRIDIYERLCFWIFILVFAFVKFALL
jgi:IS30 family transposase